MHVTSSYRPNLHIDLFSLFRLIFQNRGEWLIRTADNRHLNEKPLENQDETLPS